MHITFNQMGNWAYPQVTTVNDCHNADRFLDYIFRNFLRVFDTCSIPSMRTLVQSKYAMNFILELIPAIIAGSMLQ